MACHGGRARPPRGDRPILNPHLADAALGTKKRFAFRTAGGNELGAIILMPPSWREGAPCPTVVNFYPGSRPSTEAISFSTGEAEVLQAQLLASRGFAVLTPDVPYDPAAPGDPAEVSAAAVLPAVNEAIRLGYSDPDRLAVTGQSYGGYGVLTVLCRTSRFRAAVASASFADLVSLYGRAGGDPEGDIGWEAYCEGDGQSGMGAPPWERPLRYVRNSPVFEADRIHTPLLLVCGGADRVSPWSQSAEIFVALRRLGRRCTLLVYPGEGHSPDRFSRGHRDDMTRRVLAWLAEHLR